MQLPWQIEDTTNVEEPLGKVLKEIPDGEILTVIMDQFGIEAKPSGAVMADIRYTVTEGEYANQKVWDSMNLVKKDGSINDISKHQLRWIANKIGLDADQAADTDNFLNKPMQIKVGKERNQDSNYPDKTIPVAWRALGESFDQRNTAKTNAAAQPVAAPETNTPAWHKV